MKELLTDSNQLSESEPMNGIIAAKKAYKLAQNIGNSNFQLDAVISIVKNFNAQSGLQDSAKYYLDLGNSIVNNADNDTIKFNFFVELGAYYYRKYMYKTAIEILKEKLEQFPNLYVKNAGRAYYIVGSIERSNGNYNKSLEYFEEGLMIYKKINNPRGMTNILTKMGQVNKTKGNYEAALEFYHQALDLTSNNQIEDKKIKIYLGLGVLYKNIKDYDRAFEYLGKGELLAKKYDEGSLLGNIYMSYGHIYKHQNELEKALSYYSSSYELAEKDNDSKLQVSILNSIGNIYKRKKEYSKALSNFSIAKQISDKYDYYFNKVESTYNSGLMLAYMGKPNEGISMMHEALNLATKIKSFPAIETCYEYMCEIYILKNDYKNALKYSELRLDIKDSLFSSNKSEQIANIETKYETKIKEKEIRLLQSEQKLSSLELESSKNLTYLLIAISILLSSGGFLLLRLYKQKQNSNILLTKNNLQINQLNGELKIRNDRLSTSEKHLKSANESKDKFFSIIAHDLQNPNQALKGYAELLKKEFHNFNEDELKSIIDNIYNTTYNQQKLLENLLTWARSQTGRIEFRPENFILSDIIFKTIDPLTLSANQKSIKILPRLDKQIEVFADREMVATICRNLIGNAIKFSNINSTITIYNSDDLKSVVTTVQDSGVGIEEELSENLFSDDLNKSTQGTSREQGTGLGLLICKEFVEMNGGEIWVDSKINEGSKFHFSLPISTLKN